MICPQCGFNCKDGARFCGKCGNKLADISNFTVSENSSELSKQLPQNNISNPSSTLSIGTPEPDSLSDTLENKPLSDELNSSDNTSLPVNTEKKIKINLKREVPKKKRRIGYSKVVSTPEFIAKLRQHNFKNLLKGLLLIIAPTVFLFVYSLFPNGVTSGDAIKFGLGIGVVISLFLSIIFLQRTFGKPWEGIVMSKKFETRTRQKGKYHTDISSSICRVHKGGVWQMTTDLYKRINSYKAFSFLATIHKDNTDVKQYIYNIRIALLRNIIRLYIEEGDVKDFLYYYLIIMKMLFTKFKFKTMYVTSKDFGYWWKIRQKM